MNTDDEIKNLRLELYKLKTELRQLVENFRFHHNQKSVLTTQDVARQLDVSSITVYSWDRKNILKPDTVTAGGHRRYTQESINAFVAKCNANKDTIKRKKGRPRKFA